MNLYAIFGRVVQVGLQEGGVNSFGVFYRIPMNLDTVVVMGLVHHPMYVVVISSPIDSSFISCMVRVTLYTHACTHARTCIWSIYIYLCAQGLCLLTVLLYRPLDLRCRLHVVNKRAPLLLHSFVVSYTWLLTACFLPLTTTVVQLPLLLTV